MNPKLKAVIRLVSTVLGGVGLRARYMKARDKRDRLVMVDVLISVAGLITGTALAVRQLRKGEDDE